MRAFRDIPIKQKLVVAILVTTAAGMLLSGAGILLADNILFRNNLQRDLAALSRIVADNTTAALAFNDASTASETLAALRARPHLVSACIYRTDGTILASYHRLGATQACPAPAAQSGIRSLGDNLVVSQAIMLQNRRVGSLVILYDLGEIGDRTRLFGAAILGVLLASSVVAFGLSGKLRATIATPTLRLVEAATSISKTRDFSIRAKKLSGDELGVLTDAFNEMLASIQSRERELRQAILDREAALTEADNARKFLETTLGSIGDAVISTDMEGRVMFVNPVAQAMLGYSPEQTIERPLEEVFRIVNEFTRAPVENPVSKVLREGSIVGMANHTVLISREGKEIPIDDSAAPIRDGSGVIQGTVLVFRDVTARRRAQEITRRLASIVESSQDAIVAHDLEGLFTSWNNGAQRIFGYSAEEMIGRPTSLIASPEDGDEMPEVLARIRRGERVDQYQAPRRTKDGRVIEVSITVSPILDELGRIVGASKIARDVTEQVRAAKHLAELNAALRVSNDRLARSNEDLERFAFVASHDLQEPLRMISTYSQLLVRTYPSAAESQTKMFIDYILGGTKRMRELLADLLAYAEIGARGDDPASAVDMSLVLDKVADNLKTSIDESGAQITVDRLPIVKAHEAHFIALFQNLIGNAIKYRGPLPPRIQVSMEQKDGNMRFAVTDNGIGIAPEYREKVFVPFKRLHGKNIPGTGIGLAICQRIVERYGGRIWVESEEGHGATFRFTLPFELLSNRES